MASLPIGTHQTSITPCLWVLVKFYSSDPWVLDTVFADTTVISSCCEASPGVCGNCLHTHTLQESGQQWCPFLWAVCSSLTSFPNLSCVTFLTQIQWRQFWLPTLATGNGVTWWWRWWQKVMVHILFHMKKSNEISALKGCQNFRYNKHPFVYQGCSLCFLPSWLHSHSTGRGHPGKIPVICEAYSPIINSLRL